MPSIDVCLGALQIGDEDRGYQIELLLTKLRFATDAATSQLSPNEGLQVIGMSATMPNGSQLATWLKAEFLQTEFRPVPLTQHILVRTNGVRTLSCPPSRPEHFF